MDIGWHEGSRDELRPLFELAEDSEEQLRSYIDEGRVLVARSEHEIVAHLLLVVLDGDGLTVEVKNMAVLDSHQGRGIGRALVQRAVDECRADGAATILVATGAADVGNLRFYQRVGFRMLRVERDVFTPAAGYLEPIVVDGIPLLDRVWFSLDL